MLGKRIAKAREYAGFSNQKDFALLIGIGTRTLSDYETNNSEPKATMLIKIADICNVSIDWLLTGNGKMILDEPYIPLIDESKIDYYDIYENEGKLGITKEELKQYIEEEPYIPLIDTTTYDHIKHYKNGRKLGIGKEELRRFMKEEEKKGSLIPINVKTHLEILFSELNEKDKETKKNIMHRLDDFITELRKEIR